MGKCVSTEEKPDPVRGNREYTVDPSTFVKLKHENIRNSYEIQEKISEGAFGVVYKAIHKASKTQRAVKMISIDSTDKNSLNDLLREVGILRRMDNPHIIKIYEVFQSESNLGIVTEFCRGGELYSRIVEMGGFSENLAAKYIHQIASAVCYLHSNRIVHRDLKPENVLFESEETDSKLKLIDFGTCKHINKNAKLVDRIGSAYYIAPEVISGNYDEKCDVWSLGVILFIMISGSPPFGGKNNGEIISNILLKEPRYDPKKWKNVSDDAARLVKAMLTKNVLERITAQQVVNHPWVQKYINSDQPNKKLATRSFKNLAKFTTSSKLHRATLSYIVNQMMSSQELSKLRDLFSSLDKNGDGLLSVEELAHGASVLSSEITDNLKKIIENVDEDGNGHINYSEFLIAATNWQKKLSRERLQEVFKEFDKDGSGGISVEELVEALGGSSGQSHVFVEMVKQADTNNDGQIDLEEFIAFMEKIKDQED
jgi:calcium-dependent protein kinase